MNILNAIAEGSFGKVFRAEDCKTGRIFAVKQFIENPTLECEQLRREYAMLKACQHSNILKCHKLVQAATDSPNAGHCYLVLDYYPLDLRQFLLNQKPRSPTVLQSMTRQILQAVDYLHTQHRIVHTDIKPGNFLVSEDATAAATATTPPSVILCDFSSALVTGSEAHKMARGHEYGTLWYRAPENFLGVDSRTNYIFGTPMDMWAVGCVLFELVTNKPLLVAHSDHEQFLLICTLFGTPSVQNWPDVKFRRKYTQLQKMPNYVNRSSVIIKRSLASSGAPREFIDLVLRLLVLDPVQRLTSTEALAHPFVKLAIYP